jgi:hypothetical protein
MMAATVLSRVAADGVTLILTPAGTIKARGTETAVKHWLPVIRANKATLLEALNDHQSRKLNQTAKPDRLPAEDQGRQDRTHSANPNTGDARSADAAGTHTQASAQGLVEERLSDPDTTCPACGSGQYWQLPGEPWHGRQGEPNTSLTATTLTRACHKAPASPAGAHAGLDTRFKTACEGLSLTPARLRTELIDDLDVIASDGLTPHGWRQVAETLAASLPPPNEAIDMLAQHPELTYTFATTGDDNPDYVYVDIAIRGLATGKLRMPRGKYDGLKALELIQQHNNNGDSK